MYKLRDMLRRYSSFIQFPIELWAEKTEYEQVVDEEAPAPENPEDEPKMKTVSKTTEGVCDMDVSWHRGGEGAAVLHPLDRFRATL